LFLFGIQPFSRYLTAMVKLNIYPAKKKANVLKKIHNMSSSGGSAWGGRHRIALSRGKIPFLNVTQAYCRVYVIVT